MDPGELQSFWSGGTCWWNLTPGCLNGCVGAVVVVLGLPPGQEEGASGLWVPQGYIWGHCCTWCDGFVSLQCQHCRAGCLAWFSWRLLCLLAAGGLECPSIGNSPGLQWGLLVGHRWHWHSTPEGPADAAQTGLLPVTQC